MVRRDDDDDDDVWWRSSGLRVLGNVVCLFIIITPESTLTQIGNICKNPIYESDRNCSLTKDNETIQMCVDYFPLNGMLDK